MGVETRFQMVTCVTNVASPSCFAGDAIDNISASTLAIQTVKNTGRAAIAWIVITNIRRGNVLIELSCQVCFHTIRKVWESMIAHLETDPAESREKGNAVFKYLDNWFNPDVGDSKT